MKKADGNAEMTLNGIGGSLSSMSLIVNRSSEIYHHVLHLSGRSYTFNSSSHKQAGYWSISKKIRQLNSTTPSVTKVEDTLAKEISNERIWYIFILRFRQ